MHSLLFPGVILVLTSFAGAQNVLPDASRTNGRDVLDALSPLQAQSAPSHVSLGSSQEDANAGILITGDGYIVGKASETAALEHLRAFLEDGTNLPARVIKRDSEFDLLLCKIERTGLRPVTWGGSIAIQTGQWLWAFTSQGRDIRLGVSSASRRAIPNSGAVLGIRMGADDPDDGVLIEEVAESSPAEQAGIRAGDLVVKINDEAVSSNEALNRVVSRFQPGDLIAVHYLREGRPGTGEVRLASKNRVLMNWSGEDFGNHGTSLRTDNFPEVLQHDLPLTPADMGGALYDLQGRAVGLNIARVDRVTNYALPVESFQQKVTAWIQEDRDRTSESASKK